MIHIEKDRFVENVRRKFLGINDLLDEFDRVLPQHGPKNFLHATKLYIYVFQKYFEDKLKREQSEEDVIKLCKEIMNWLVEVHEHFFPYLAESKDASVPSELFPAFVQIVRKLFKIKSGFEFGLFPSWEHNYGFYGFQDIMKNKDISLLVEFLPDETQKDISEKAEKLPQWIVFYSYPHVETNLTLSLTPLIHEIAHLKDHDEKIHTTLLPEKFHEESFNKYITLITTSPAPSGRKVKKDAGSEVQLTVGDFLSIENLKQSEYKKISKIITNWIKEIVADLLTVHVIGPAYLFSFIETLIMPGTNENYSDTHPSAWLRLKLMVEEIEFLGYTKDLHNIKLRDKLKEYNERLSEYKASPTEPISEVAYLSIKDKFPEIQKKVREVIGEGSFKCSIYNKNVPMLIEEFKKGIPPIERWSEEKNDFEPYDFISILNAAWEFYETDFDQFYNLLDAKSDGEKWSAYNNFNSLLLKAIETVELIKIYKRSN